MNTRTFILTTLTVAIGTLIALAVVGLIAKRKYDEQVQSNPLLRLFGS